MNVYEIFDIEIENNSSAHAYLFIGGSRADWTSYLDYITSKLKCLVEDVVLVEPEEIKGKGGEIKVQQVREILHLVSLSPHGDKRIVAIFNSEKFNQSSGNVLLKSLEEPQSQTVFLLFAKFDSVLPTIKSRCRVVYLNAGSERDDSTSSGFDPKVFRESFLDSSREIELIVKQERTLDFCDDLSDYLRGRLIEVQDPKIVQALEVANWAKRDIASNANARLTLENLILKIRKYL